jgi:hypothetical protein
MHKFLYISLLISSFSLSAHSQSLIEGNEKPNIYEYYIRITGIHTKQDVINLQNNISKKSGVIFFMANRYPVRYFFLKSERQISYAEFKNWMIDPSWDIEFYGVGSKGKEQATVLYNKTKTSQ